MMPIKAIMKRDFHKVSYLESVGSAAKVMEKLYTDCLLVEEEGGITGMVTSRELVGYPSSRLVLDCLIQPICTVSGEILADEALRTLEERKVAFLVVLNKEGMPVGVVNQGIVIQSLFQELRKLNEEKDEYIAELERVEELLQNAYQELSDTHVQLVQAGKLTAMGEMAAGIVHELTQPLLGITGFATALLEDMKRSLQTKHSTASEKTGNESAVADLELILQQTDRMTKILNMVRDFARASGTEMALLDINKPIEEALLLFSEQLRLHNIVVEKNLARDLPLVMGNANQLQQVFINLITNARDAMDAKDGEGQLTVNTRVSSTDDSILIELVDNGIGADAETLSRMFEPFFTTKTKGKGTGLGLSIVDRITKEHRGTIHVQSEPGRGFKFTIRLPLGAGEKDGESG